MPVEVSRLGSSRMRTGLFCVAAKLDRGPSKARMPHASSRPPQKLRPSRLTKSCPPRQRAEGIVPTRIVAHPYERSGSPGMPSMREGSIRGRVGSTHVPLAQSGQRSTQCRHTVNELIRTLTPARPSTGASSHPQGGARTAATSGQYRLARSRYLLDSGPAVRASLQNRKERPLLDCLPPTR